MLRSILVGVDGWAHAEAAVRLAIRWGKRFDARLVGIGRPRLRRSEETRGGEATTQDLEVGGRHAVEATLSRAEALCAEAGVGFDALEDVDPTSGSFLVKAQRHDLIVLSRQSYFPSAPNEGSVQGWARLLAESSRPVVAVADDPGHDMSVAVAYDGSLQAAHTLAAFETSGLGQGCAIHVVSIAGTMSDAARRADRAVQFLRSHGHDAHPHPLESSSSASEVLLNTIPTRNLGLVVLGAYGQPILRDFALGSTTRAMLGRCRTPLLMYH